MARRREIASLAVATEERIEAYLLYIAADSADLPPLGAETRVRLAIGRIDLLTAALEVRYAGLGAG